MFANAYASASTKSLYQTTDDRVEGLVHPTFRLNYGSASRLTTLQADGRAPARKTFDFNLSKAGAEGFRLKLGGVSDIEEKARLKEERRKVREQFYPQAGKRESPKGSLKEDGSLAANVTRGGAGSATADSAAGVRLDAGLSASSSAPALGASADGASLEQSAGATQEKKMTRADKYYHALLKAEWQRNERIRKEKEEEKLSKAEAAAAAAFKAVTKAEKEEKGESEDSEAEEEVPDEEEVDAGPLQPYDGALRLEVEVVVLRAPGGKDTDDGDSGGGTTATPASSRSTSVYSEERVDLSKELQALQEELGPPENEEVESEGSDGLPDGLRLRKIPMNIHDAQDKRVALGLGGTAFFVPDVERYAMAPSLLPPPPQSLAGRRRLRLKPRLPLEVSRNRWRDEHPSIGADPAYSPDVNERKSYEDKMCMVDLYHGVHSVMSQVPKPDGIRRPPPEKLFDKMLDEQLKNSRAWKQHIKRERVLFIAAQEAQIREQARLEEAAKRMEGGFGGAASSSAPQASPAPSFAPQGAGTPAAAGNRTRGSDPPSPPEAGGPGVGLMGVAPGVRAGV